MKLPIKYLLSFLMLCTPFSAAWSVTVVTAEMSAKGNTYYESPVYTVDADIDGEYWVGVISTGNVWGGTLSLVHNGVNILTEVPVYTNNPSGINRGWSISTTIPVKKGDTLQAIANTLVPENISSLSATIEVVIGTNAKNNIWIKSSNFNYNFVPCTATVPTVVDLGSFSAGTTTPVSLPLQVSSPGLLRLNIDHANGVIPLRNGADTLLSLDLSSYYDAIYNRISWNASSGSAINGNVIVPQNAAVGEGSVTGSFTLNCE